MKRINVIREEFYKIFIKKRFIWVFLVVFALEMFQFSQQPKPTSFLNTESEVLYKENIKELQGVYDEEKSKTILETAEYTFDYEKEMSKSSNTPTEYQSLLSKYPTIYESIPVYTMLKSQVEYVQDDPTHRYFMDASGWEVLLTDSEFDYLLVFLVIIMAASIYSNEYETNVDILNRSSYLGRVNRYILQTLIIIGSLSLLLLSINLGRYLMIFDTVKQTGAYPIQSVPIFANALFNTSIMQTFVLLIGIRIVGIVYIVSLISFITQQFKNSLLSLFAGFLIVLVPFLVFKPFELYAYPLPTTWFMGTGLIQGPSLSPHVAMSLYSVGHKDLGIIIISTLTLIGLMWWLTIYNLRRGK